MSNPSTEWLLTAIHDYMKKLRVEHGVKLFYDYTYFSELKEPGYYYTLRVDRDINPYVIVEGLDLQGLYDEVCKIYEAYKEEKTYTDIDDISCSVCGGDFEKELICSGREEYYDCQCEFCHTERTIYMNTVYTIGG